MWIIKKFIIKEDSRNSFFPRNMLALHPSFLLLLIVGCSVSNAQVDTKPDEPSLESEDVFPTSLKTDGRVMDAYKSSMNTNNNMSPYQMYSPVQQQQPYSNTPRFNPAFNRPMFGNNNNNNWGSPYPMYPQYNMQPQWQGNPYWNNPWQVQQQQASYETYQPSGYPMKPEEESSPTAPTISTYTDYENGFYPGSPNWRKSFTPGTNGCFNRCRPSCGYNGSGYNYGCRPNCRSSCNIRPSCGSSMPSYYGNTMVCSRNNGYYPTQPNYGYRSGFPSNGYEATVSSKNKQDAPTVQSMNVSN